jgi:hypothetical protein
LLSSCVDVGAQRRQVLLDAQLTILCEDGAQPFDRYGASTDSPRAFGNFDESHPEIGSSSISRHFGDVPYDRFDRSE